MVSNILKNDDIREIYCIAGKIHVENFNTIFGNQRICCIEGINHCVDVSRSVKIKTPIVLSPVLSPVSPSSFLSKSSIKRKSNKSKSSIKRKSRKSKSSIKIKRKKSRKNKSSIKRKSINNK
jgi:hypothetical protein